MEDTDSGGSVSGESQSLLEKERAERSARLLERQESAKKRKALLDSATAIEEKSSEDIESDEEEEEEEVEVRESMVENAVKFLSNESVKKTPLVRRVAFLEKKGLTQAEITTAMQRVSSGDASSAPVKKKKKTVRRVVYEDDDDEEEVVVVRRGAKPASLAPPLPPPPPPQPPKSTWTWTSLATTTFVTLGAVGGLIALMKAMIPPKERQRRSDRPEPMEDRMVSVGGPSTPIGRGMPNDSSPYSTPQQFHARQGSYGHSSSPYQPKTPAQQVEELKDQMSELVKVVTTQQSTLQTVQNVLNTPKQASSSATTQQLESIDVNELKSAISQLQQLLAESRTPAKQSTWSAQSGTASAARVPPSGAAPLQRTPTPATLAANVDTGTNATGSSPATVSARNPSYLATTNFSAASTPSKPAYVSKFNSTATAPAYGAPPSREGTPAPKQSADVAPASQASPAGYSKGFIDVMNKVRRGEEVPGIRTDIDDSPADPTQVVQTGATEPPPKPWEARLKARQQRFAKPAASPAPSYLNPIPAREEDLDEEAEIAPAPKVEEIIDDDDDDNLLPVEVKQEEPEE